MFIHDNREVVGYRFKKGLFGKQILQVKVKISVYCLFTFTKKSIRYRYRNATCKEAAQIDLVAATVD